MTHDDYLWNKSGRPDPDVARLERLLAPHGYRAGATRRVRLYVRWAAGLAAAAMLLVVWQSVRHSGPASETGWYVDAVMGAPTVAERRTIGTAAVSAGDWLVTDDTSAAIITVGREGRVRVAPNTRVRIMATDSTHQRLRLEQGTLNVSIWAPPRVFFVETPGAVAVDLGCIYTLTIDEAGHGTLCVESGWVALQRDGRESLVPEGALCDLRADAGPGTPYLAGASTDYLDDLERYDFDLATHDELDALIRQADECDVFSLVFLLPRVPVDARRRIFDRVSSFVPPWPGITRDGIAALDPEMVEAWQDQLGCFELQPCRATCDAALRRDAQPRVPL